MIPPTAYFSSAFLVPSPAFTAVDTPVIDSGVTRNNPATLSSSVIFSMTESIRASSLSSAVGPSGTDSVDSSKNSDDSEDSSEGVSGREDSTISIPEEDSLSAGCSLVNHFIPYNTPPATREIKISTVR